MPELPEVETVVRSLRRGIVGARIESVALHFHSVFKHEDPAEFLWLEGCTFRQVERAGKYILIDLDRDKMQPEASWRRHEQVRAPAAAKRSTAAGDQREPSPKKAAAPLQLMVHLGMTGKLVLVSPDAPREKHTHAVLTLVDGRELRYVDPRRFGRIALARRNGESPSPTLGIASGVEPLEVDEQTFATLFAGRKAPIKSALLNQKLLRGMGNIYADESLFRAGIHPRAHSVSRPRLRRLRAAIVRVLTEAIKAGGSSISDYVDSEGRRGWFQFKHRVYGREGKPCLKCRTPIRRTVIAGRSSHYCPHCQKR